MQRSQRIRTLRAACSSVTRIKVAWRAGSTARAAPRKKQACCSVRPHTARSMHGTQKQGSRMVWMQHCTRICMVWMQRGISIYTDASQFTQIADMICAYNDPRYYIDCLQLSSLYPGPYGHDGLRPQAGCTHAALRLHSGCCKTCRYRHPCSQQSICTVKSYVCSGNLCSGGCASKVYNSSLWSLRHPRPQSALELA